jgi:hypothetical protein
VEHLDTVIAFVVAMLGVSLIVLIGTQSVSALLGYRGTNLKWGLIQLLKTADPKLDEQAEAIAQRILTHPLISDSNMARFARRFANVPLLGLFLGRIHLASSIRLEELIGLLQKVSAGSSPALGPRLVPEVQQWFDSAMDRVRQRFAMQMRIWTIVFSFLFVLVLHFDAIRLYKHLSSDPIARAELAASSQAMLNLAPQITQAPASPAIGDNAKAQAEQLTMQAKEVQKQLTKADFPLSPMPFLDFSHDNLSGLLLAGILLSLGAPFWFNALKSLCSLRPVPAGTTAKADQSSSAAAGQS